MAANPIQFKEIADLEAGINKTIKDLQKLDRTTKSVFKSMKTEGDKLEKSMSDSVGRVDKLRDSFKKLDPAIEKDRQSIIGLNEVLSQEKAILEGVTAATTGLGATQKVAADSVNGLKARVKELTIQFNKLSISANPAKIRRLGAEIVKTRTQIKNLNDVTRRTVNTFNAAQGSYNGLINQNKRLSAILRKLPIEFTKTNSRAKRLAATLRANTSSLKQFDAALGRNFRNVGNYGTALKGLNSTIVTNIAGLTGLTAGVAGVGLVLREGIQDVLNYSDQIAGVRTTTGLTAEQVENLADKLRELNTRTSLEGLLNIARAAGRFQVAEEQLASFVESVDLVLVALRNDLGDDSEAITTDLTRILDVFGLLEEGAEAENITRLGSVINDLGNKTKANARFIIDFTTDIAGIAAASGLSVPFVAGLGAAMQESGVEANIAVTAFTKLFVEIGKTENFKKFSELMGITVDEFADLVENNPEQVLIDLLKAATSTSGGFKAFGDILKTFGLDGVRTARLLVALTENMDKVTRDTDLGTKAWALNTSVQKEAAIQMDTAKGSVEQLGNAWTNFITNLQSSGFGGVITTITDWLKFLTKFADTGVGKFFVDFLGNVTLGFLNLVNIGDDFKESWLGVKLGLNDTSAAVKKFNDELGETGNIFESANEGAEETGKTLAQLNSFYQGMTTAQKALVKQYQELIDVDRKFSEGTLTDKELKKLEKALKDIVDTIDKEALKALKKLAKSFDLLGNAEAHAADELKKVKELFDFLDKQDTVFGNAEGINEVVKGFVDGEGKKLAAIGETESVKKRAAAKDAAAAQEQADLEEQLKQESIARAIDTTNFLFNIRADNIANQIQLLENQFRLEIELAGDNEDAKVELEDTFNTRRSELRAKEARNNKAQALFNIALSTAEGVASALPGFPGTLPFIAIIAALGIAQAAAVASQPIPSFAKGGRSPGGLILVAEEGPEIMQTGDGVYQKYETPTLVDSPRGAQIFDAVTTRSMEDHIATNQAAGAFTHNISHSSNEIVAIRNFEVSIKQSNDEVIRAIKNIPLAAERLNIQDTHTEVTRRNQRQIYLNSKYKLNG
jgi:TP901 family phage tail tape measure protein